MTAVGRLRQRLSGHSVDRGGVLALHSETIEPIPIFAVGYKGWKSSEPIETRLRISELDGVLNLGGRIFVESDRLPVYQKIHLIETQADLRAHKRIIELAALGADVEAIALKLNAEGLTSSPVHLGDQRCLPNVAVNSWTGSAVEASIDVVRRRTETHTGTAALFAFVRRVHAELAKRSAMSVDLRLYG